MKSANMTSVWDLKPLADLELNKEYPPRLEDYEKIAASSIKFVSSIENTDFEITGDTNSEFPFTEEGSRLENPFLANSLPLIIWNSKSEDKLSHLFRPRYF